MTRICKNQQLWDFEILQCFCWRLSWFLRHKPSCNWPFRSNDGLNDSARLKIRFDQISSEFKIQFPTSFIATAALLITSTTAIEVWDMSESTVIKPSGEVQLEIYAFEGPQGNAFRCERALNLGPLHFPIKNLPILCQAGSALAFSWEDESKDMSTMFTAGGKTTTYSPQAYACSKSVGGKDGGCKFVFMNGPDGVLFSGSAQPRNAKREEMVAVSYQA
ncbi:hypothetical protein HYALB_00011212 [Hymenoscyphus albidus]|uniref:Uncharacterized protein n=1 Tax=Hymenoscyphus albidus TaxID=595503 RepID=A0A9N9LQI4_9HELO|nr:hypothetical protein HYALB_00011212 [Hymenoscyphus albidus]